MNSELFFSFITSLLICMALIPPLGLLASRLHIVDQPGERKVHQNPVPTVGGIAFAVGAFVSILWWGPKNSTTLGVLFGGFHLGWSTLVALGLAQGLLDFIFGLHMIANPYQVMSFDITKAGMLIVITFLVGYGVGHIFANVWNKVHK